MTNFPLSETYRPKDFNEVMGIQDLSNIDLLLKTPSEMPSFLFHGPQGTGKTTVAKIIVNKLKPIDVLKLNGSDTTGVDTIRERVYNFMTSLSSEPDKPKIIWIEEFDYLSANAFAALRSMMEQYMKNARFICTCNYLYKIPEPIQSRFTSVEFKKPKDEFVFARLRYICDLEGITVQDEVLKALARRSRGDFRTAINTVQQLSSNEVKSINAFDIDRTTEISKQVYDLLIEGRWSDIRYHIPLKYPDYQKLLVDLDQMFFESDLPIEKKAEINEIISSGMMEMSLSFDDNISFAAISSRIIKILQ